jgi:hypothetical protein
VNIAAHWRSNHRSRGSLRIFFAAKLNRESQSYFCNQTRLVAVQKENGDGYGLEYWLCDRGGNHLVSRSMDE